MSRIYPDVYKPKVVGMMWSMLAQEQVNIINTTVIIIMVWLCYVLFIVMLLLTCFVCFISDF